MPAQPLEEGLDDASDMAAAATPADVAARLGRRAAALGLGTFTFGSADNPGRFGSTWPDHWVRLYVEQGLVRVDPLVRDAGWRVAPFTWSELRAGRPISPGEALTLDLAAEHGWRDGFAVPVHGPGGYLALAVFAGDRAELSSADRARLHLAVVVAHDRALALAPDPAVAAPVRLTAREAEVLSWFAAGKTDWETGEILGLSEKTVRWHADNARRKFAARNRVQAVAQAVWRGLIRL